MTHGINYGYDAFKEPSLFWEHLDKVKSLEDKIWVGTFREVAAYIRELSPFIIMFTIPLAFTGGLFALYFTGNEVSVVAMIGFVMLAGIIVNNGIVMVDFINQLRRGGMEKKDAIIESGKTRLRPILMTALTTILSMSTMAVGLGEGSEMMQPMAIVTVGGLLYGTLLTLIVVPCIYDAFNRNKSMVEEDL